MQLASSWARGEAALCFEVIKVLGQVYCNLSDLTTGKERRAGRETDDEEIMYFVRGKFGSDASDEYFPDTRWVHLSELVENLAQGDESWDVIDAYANELHDNMVDARERLEE